MFVGCQACWLDSSSTGELQSAPEIRFRAELRVMPIYWSTERKGGTPEEARRCRKLLEGGRQPRAGTAG